MGQPDKDWSTSAQELSENACMQEQHRVSILEHLLKRECLPFWKSLIDAHQDKAETRPLPSVLLQKLTADCSDHFFYDVADPDFKTPDVTCNDRVVGHCMNLANGASGGWNLYFREKVNYFFDGTCADPNSQCTFAAETTVFGECRCQRNLCAVDGECVDIGEKPKPVFIIRKGYAFFSQDDRIVPTVQSSVSECSRYAQSFKFYIFTYEKNTKRCYCATLVKAQELGKMYIGQWEPVEENDEIVTGVNMYEYDNPIDELIPKKHGMETQSELQDRDMAYPNIPPGDNGPF